MYDKTRNSHEWTFSSSEESYQSLSMNLKSTCQRGLQRGRLLLVTSNVSSDSSSLSLPAWDPLQAPYSTGRTKTKGWNRQLGLVLSRVDKKSGEKEVSFSHPSSYSGFLVFLSTSCRCEVVLEKIFHSSHAASPSPGRLVLPEKLPYGEGLMRGVGVT